MGRGKRRLFVVCLAVGAFAPASARAETGVLVPLGRLGIAAGEGVKVERWMQAAFQSLPELRWVSSSRLDKLLHQPKYSKCDNQSVCLGALARDVGADFAVAGEVGSLGGAFMVYLRLVTASGKAVRSANEVLDPNIPGLRDKARALAFQLLTPDKFAGQLQVEVDVANAWIYLDGRRIGQSPTGIIAGVSVGTHALRVTHPAYHDFVRFVQVEFEKIERVPVSLSAFPVRAEEMKLVDPEHSRPMTDKELPWYRRWWMVTTFGAVVLGGAAATLAIIARGSVPRDSESLVRP